MDSNKTKLKYLMYKLKMRKTIPAGIINGVNIQENHEPLINILNDHDFYFSEQLSQQKEIFLRRSVAKKLKVASQQLPNGIKFKIYSAYRSLELQQQKWEERLNQNRLKFPQLDNKELELLTRSQIADPRNGFGGHQTGGAIDITLCTTDGNDLDMGTRISEHNRLTSTNSKQLSDIQRKNRKLLQKVLEQQGFKNYPAEWWHFSYGDRIWAAYSNKKQCVYGLTDKDRM